MSKKVGKYKMISIMSDPAYKGKHVIVVEGKVFTAKTGPQANKILEMVHKKYPSKTPEITYIPKADTLILMQKSLFGQQNFISGILSG